MEKAKQKLHAGGERVPETGAYFNAGKGEGVRGGLRRFEAGETFPGIKTGHFWKFVGTEEELGGALPKRGHQA